MSYALLRGDVSSTGSTLRFLHCTKDDIHDVEPEPGVSNRKKPKIMTVPTFMMR